MQLDVSIMISRESTNSDLAIGSHYLDLGIA